MSNPYFLISGKLSAMFQLVVLSLLLVQVGIVVGKQQGSPRSTVLPLLEDSNKDNFWNNVEQEIRQTANNKKCCGHSCYCDPHCTVFDDCCSADLQYANTTSISQRQLPKDTFTCERIREISVKTISFVNRCPLNYGDAGIRSECETMERNGILNVPVSDPVTDILYRNVYCALCHNVTKYVYWLQKMLCNMQETTSLTLTESFQSFIHNNCSENVRFFHQNFTHRVCKPHVSSCIAGWVNDMHKEACASHTNFITVKWHYYKNKYCALCNNMHYANFRSSQCRGRGRGRGRIKPTKHSFSIIMDANSGQHYTDIENIHSGRQCRPTEVYDDYNDMCRALQCTPPLVLDKGRCIHPLSGFNISGVALACPLVVLNATEYESFENKSIWVHTLKILLAADQYQLNGSEVSICVQWVPQWTQVQMFKYDKIQAIVSFIGQVISLTALAVNFLTYMLFPSLRNLPGKCIMNLVLALFVAHLLFIVGVGQTGDRKVCMAVAMVMHYCFLASFFWMNGLAFELWRTFTRIEVRHN